MQALLRRVRSRPDAVYIGLTLWVSLLFALAFTTNLIYYVQVVGLDPLQMVLLGTILEGAVLLFEVPTGILADLKGRKVSIMVGYVLTGLAFCLQALAPHFWAVALAQAVWGIGYTFTSGAEQAWIADEVGPERAAQAFSRARQAAQVASLVGVALAGLLGAIDLALPVLVCGVGMLAMAGALPLVMRETGFAPADHADLSGWQAMLRTASQAVALARRRPIVLWLLISGVVVGLYSEGYDRLWMPHLLQNVGLPDAPALPTATWFAGVRMISAMLGIGVVEFTRRRLLTSHDRRLRWVLSGAALGIVAGILVVALAGSFWLAALAVIIIGPLRTATALLRDAWLNRQIDDPTVRATIFSALGQADSVGQVVGGPAIGWLARAVSIPLAMTVSALLLTPVVPIYALTGRKNTEYIESGNSVG